jgi:hypothetical protein
MSASETSRFVRLRAELVLEVTDIGELSRAALERIAADEYLTDEERAHAEAAVREDEAEALAYLVDPFDLVGRMPGMDVAQASWSSERIEDYDPEAVEWDLDDGDDADDKDADDGGDDADDGADRVQDGNDPRD